MNTPTAATDLIRFSHILVCTLYCTILCKRCVCLLYKSKWDKEMKRLKLRGSRQAGWKEYKSRRNKNVIWKEKRWGKHGQTFKLQYTCDHINKPSYVRNILHEKTKALSHNIKQHFCQDHSGQPCIIREHCLRCVIEIYALYPLPAVCVVCAQPTYCSYSIHYPVCSRVWYYIVANLRTLACQNQLKAASNLSHSEIIISRVAVRVRSTYRYRNRNKGLVKRLFWILGNGSKLS